MNLHPKRLGIAIALLVASSISANAQDTPVFSVEQIDQMMAPVALYPDSLLSMILMASTYPADVAAAAEWSAANPDAKGDDAVLKVEGEAWDPSVKSLVAFPEVLAMMHADPDWVQNLGDAFLAQPNDVMDSAQRLRALADEAGTLESNDQQNVIVQEGDTTQETTIIIESSDPEVIYVPSYQPTVVYGTWPYPTYPPYYLPPPPGYYWGAALATGIAFTAGVIVGDALWGDCDWGGGDIDIDVNRYNNVNVNNRLDVSNTNWNHNSANRGGTPYRGTASQSKYGQNVSGAADRQDFRGYDASSASRDAQRDASRAALEGRTGVDTRDARGPAAGGGLDRSGSGLSQGSLGDRGAGASQGALGDRSSGSPGSGISSGSRDLSSARSGSSGLSSSSSSRGSSFSGSSSRGSAFSGASSPSFSSSSANRGGSSLGSARSSGSLGGGGGSFSGSRSGGGGRGR